MNQSKLIAEDVRPALQPASIAAGKPRSLRLNFSWTLVGNAVYGACQWGMLTVLAKMGTPEMVGQFALALAIVMPVIMFANLNLRALQAAHVKQHLVFADYLGTRLLTSSAAVLVILGIALCCHYSEKAVIVVLALAAARFFDSLSDIFYGLVQKQERMDRIAVSLMIQGTVQLAALAVVVFLTKSLLLGVVSMAVVSGSVLVLYDFQSARLVLGKAAAGVSQWADVRPRWALPDVFGLMAMGLPMGFVMALSSYNGNIPRYFISADLGKSALGIFAALAYIIIIGSTVTSALIDSSLPRLARFFGSQNYTGFWRLTMKLMGVACLLGAVSFLGAACFGKPLLSLLYRPIYARHMDVFLWLMASTGPIYFSSCCGLAATAMRQFKVQVPYRLLGAAVTLLLCWSLIPREGLLGAGQALFWSSMISAAVGYGYLTLTLRRLQRQAAQEAECKSA